MTTSAAYAETSPHNPGIIGNESRSFPYQRRCEEVTAYPGSAKLAANSITESHRDSQDIHGADVG